MTNTNICMGQFVMNGIIVVWEDVMNTSIYMGQFLMNGTVVVWEDVMNTNICMGGSIFHEWEEIVVWEDVRCTNICMDGSICHIWDYRWTEQTISMGPFSYISGKLKQYHCQSTIRTIASDTFISAYIPIIFITVDL